MATAYTTKPNLLAHYLALDQGGKIQAECERPVSVTAARRTKQKLTRSNLLTDVWIDGDGGMRCKTTVSNTSSVQISTNVIWVGNAWGSS